MKKLLRLIAKALDGKEQNLTTGSISQAIVILSIPMILEMIMESLFAVVDVFFVARVGVEAVAAVGLTESVVTIVYSLAIGISMGATAMVARRVGEEDREAAATAAVQAMALAFGISVMISLVGIFYAADILRLMGGSPSLVATGAVYTRIVLGFNLVITFLFLLNGIFRGAGDAAIAMRTLWLANGINIVLDPLLIFGIGPFPELGVGGAAVATTIGRSIGVAYQIYILVGGRGVIRIRRRHLRLEPEVLRRLAGVSFTGAWQYIVSSASWIFLMRIIALFGSQAVAGYTIAIRIIIFTILPSWGFSNAAATLVGQNLGARRPDRAERSVWIAGRYNAIFLVAVSTVFLAFAPGIVGIFTSIPEVVQAGVLSLRIICLGYIFFSYGMVLSQAFNGAGDTRTPMLMNIVCFWLVEIPLGYFLAVRLDLQLAGVCWAIVIAEVLLAIMAILLFRKGHWKTVEL